jgi:hypothetical protein
MEKSIAETVATRVNAATDELIRALAPLDGVASDEEIKKMKTGLGQVVMEIAELLLKPIYKEYPDLIPPKMRTKDGDIPFIFR